MHRFAGQYGTLGDNDSPRYSLNFPTQPVHVGSKWKGFSTLNGKEGPVDYTVDQIIRYNSHTVVVYSKDGKDAKTWFDADAGDSILAVVHSRAKTKDGRTVLTTVEAYNAIE